MSSGVAIFVIEVVALESFDFTEPRLFILAAEFFAFDAREPFPLFPFFSVLTTNRVPKRYLNTITRQDYVIENDYVIL